MENFEKFLDDYQALIYRVAFKYVLNENDAEEVTQDVALKVYNKWKQFKRQSNTKTWVYRITVNTSLDFLRKKNRKKRFFSIGEHAQQDINQIEVSVEEEDENKTIKEQLLKQINILNKDQKSAIILFYWEDLKQHEIAEVMGKTTKSIESLLARARKKIKNNFEETEGF